MADLRPAVVGLLQEADPGRLARVLSHLHDCQVAQLGDLLVADEAACTRLIELHRDEFMELQRAKTPHVGPSPELARALPGKAEA